MLTLNRTNNHPIVADGSIGVELARRGYTERPPDRYNLTSPVIVERIHRDFIAAGATLIQSNTVHANRYALEQAALSARVQEINRKGVWIARTAAGGRAIVAAVLGPSGLLMQPLGPLTMHEVLDCYKEQVSALLAGGCDLLLFKSFISIDELELAIQAARALTSDMPIAALKSFPEDGAVLSGSFPAEVTERLSRNGVQAIGSNGTVGPQRMLGIIQSLRSNDLPLIAIPDVGIPTLVDGISVYDADPAYVAAAATRLVQSGVSVIGAEGGATIEHIKAIASSVAQVVCGSAVAHAKSQSTKITNHVPTEKSTAFFEAIQTGFVSTVELDIPRGIDMTSVIDGAAYLKQHGITAVNISDGARARLRMSAIAISKLVQEQTGMECITHMACRDRNMVGLQSELLGAHSLGVRNILAVTGDPTHIGDFPVASSIYDIDAVGLIRAMGKMNQGMDLMGNPIGQQTNFTIACAVNPAADDMEREIARLEKKVENGAQVVFSQPMFDADAVLAFLERIAHINVKFMLGIIPLRNMRHAEFLHFEVPGMRIPEWVRKRMTEAGTDQEKATDVGVAMSTELLQAVRKHINGVYLMPPFKKYNIAVQVLQG